MAEKIRLQFDFKDEAVNELDELKESLGLTSRIDVVKQAMGLLQWVVEIHKEGWQMIVERGKEQRIVFISPLTFHSHKGGNLTSDKEQKK